MEIKIESGAVVVNKNCDIIESGGLKIVKNYGEAKEENKMVVPLTEDELKRKIDFVRSKITSNRLWFSVCKVMMWNKMVSDGDFASAVAIIERLYPDVKLNAKDLATLNVCCFRKGLDQWTDDDAPVHGAVFSKYYSIAELMESY